MNGNIDYKLGSIDAKLEEIKTDLAEGRKKFDAHNDRIARIEIVHARGAGSMAVLGALAGIAGTILLELFKKYFLRQ